MKNKKLMFSEARFVFEVTGAPGSAPAGTPPVTTSPAQLAVAKVRTAAQTRRDLSLLKSTLQTGGFSLKGKTFEVDFGGTFVRDLTGKIETLMKAKGNDALVKRFLAIAKVANFKEEEAFEMTSRLYATEISLKARAKFNDRYKDFKTYLTEKKLNANDLKCNIEQDAKGEYTFKFKMTDQKVLDGHAAWWNKRSEAQKAKAKAAAGKEKVKGQIPPAELERFSKSPLGKLFSHWKEGGKNMIQLLQAGKAPLLALFIADLFGYKEIGGGTASSFFSMTGKHEGKFRRYAKQAADSKLGAKAFNKKHPRKVTEVGKDAQKVTAEFFGDVIDQNNFPAKGLKLESGYKLGSGETLSVDLTGGGQVVLPKGGKTRAYVDNELADPGKVYKNVKIKFSNTIPEGTVFVGKVVFKKNVPTKVVPTKAAPAKAT